MTNKSTDFYCNQKFWWLSVDLERFQTLSCCAATPQTIDLPWIKKNPGEIFNTPALQHERKMMLANQPVSSCDSSCWIPESQGIPSRRLIANGHIQTHSNIVSSPETLNIVVGTDCNMTCVYCCKFYSTAWKKDIAKGTYSIDRSDDRFIINKTDRILEFISQKEIASSSKRQLILEEIHKLCKTSLVEEVIITGGEPFLHLELGQLIESIPDKIPIKVFSGLGVDEKRFAQEIKKITKKNVSIVVSAENIENNYEFTRYGNTWKRFTTNVQYLKEQGIKYEFNATVSNLTVHGLKNFIEWADGTPINFQPCTDPDFLSIGVLDLDTKEIIRSMIDVMPDFVAQALEVVPTEKQVYNLKSYIKEFANRRSLSLEIFPPTLALWLQ